MGARRYSVRLHLGIGQVARGITQAGVRCATINCCTMGCIAGITWIADAPVPMTATQPAFARRPTGGAVAASAYALLPPARSLVRRVVLLGPAHRVVWKAGPQNISSPGIFGGIGSLSGPFAITNTSTVHVRLAVVTLHCCDASFHRAPVTSSPKWISGAMPSSFATRTK